LGGVNAELDRHNYSLLIKQIGYKQVDFVERLKEEVDGLIIIAGLNLKDEHLQQFNTVPWVRVMGRGELNHESVHVTYDNAHVGRIAADYLIKSGCTRLVYFGGVTTALFRERYDEFSGYAAKQGIEVCLIEADSRSDSMEIIVGKARNRLPELLAGDKFTGIFSSADVYCGAIYQELYRLGIEPIFDVPVISCNNNRFYLNGLYPKPGVIDIRMFEIGERAAQILLESVAGKNYKSERMVFSPRLIIEDEEARASLKVSQLAELL
jgi:DNA-binding LacI/PurR family transcriptional regulator